MKKVVYISAIWCPSCLIMRSRYQVLFDQIGESHITYLDYDEDQKAIEPFHIGTILPVLIVFDEEKEIFRVNGERSKKEVIKLLESGIA